MESLVTSGFVALIVRVVFPMVLRGQQGSLSFFIETLVLGLQRRSWSARKVVASKSVLNAGVLAAMA
jgi:hypothetical protein